MRSGKGFKCGNCGWHGDADLNGAMNISKIGAVVSRLRGSETLSCSLGLLKDSRNGLGGESPRILFRG
ncbi:zinc ribbon domain-containing protein [Thermoleptolyngbya sp.]